MYNDDMIPIHPYEDPAVRAYITEYERFRKLFEMRTTAELDKITMDTKTSSQWDMRGIMDRLSYAFDPIRRAQHDAAESILEKRLKNTS